MIKVGCIGLGKLGRLRFRICRLIKGVKVIAAADSSKRALSVARKAGVKNLYRNYADLLKLDDIDAVIISLPNFLHMGSMIASAEAGKHIFIEKPLARTSAECEKIIRLTENEGIKVAIGHNYRFLDCVKKVKSIYEMGAIGDVELSTFELVYDGFAPSLEPTVMPEWYFDPEKTGGWLFDAGYHLVDLFQWFFGEPLVLYAYLGSRFHLPFEDHAIIVLSSKNKRIKGVLNVGWFSKTTFQRFDFRVILHGTAGFVSTDQFAPRNIYVHAIKEGSKNLLRKISGRSIHPLTYTYFYSSYYQELQRFFDCLRTNEALPVTAKDAFKIAKTIEAVYRHSNRCA